MKKMTSALIVGLASLASQASPLPDYPFVYAGGQAQSNIAPNTCKVAYHITVRDRDATNGMRTVEKRSSETLGLLAENAVKKEDIVGFEITKDAVRNYEQRDSLEFLGYEMTRQIEFSLQDLQKYERIVSALLKTPDVTRIRTTFDRTDRKEIETRLMAQAVSAARAKAQLMAEGSAQRIVKLRAISEYGFYNLSGQFGLGDRLYGALHSDMARQPEKELLFVPSTIQFGNTVSVIYEIEEKK